MGGAQLYDAKDVNDVKTVLLEHAGKNKTAEWIEGRGVRYDVIANRHELDAIIADKPIYINAYDGHTSWANTKALELAGILQPGKEAEVWFS